MPRHPVQCFRVRIITSATRIFVPIAELALRRFHGRTVNSELRQEQAAPDYKPSVTRAVLYRFPLDSETKRNRLAQFAVLKTKWVYLVQYWKSQKQAMRTNFFLRFSCLIGVTSLNAWTDLSAAPLTWFPGPSLNMPISQAATTVGSGLGNVLIAGESLGYPQAFAQSLVATNSVWTYQPQLYSSEFGSGAVGNGDIIVVYGGTDGSNSTSALLGYSPSGDAVPVFPSMSVARSYMGYAGDRGGNAYAIGGLDETGAPLASSESFNSDSSTWAAIASLPSARYNFPAAFDGTDYIYTFGGRTNNASGTETATALRYSISANTLSTVAPMPIPVSGSTAACGADGKIYVVGGVSGGVTLNAVQVYTPVSNAWVISTPLPEGLNASAMGVDSLGRLIVMGGQDSNGNDVTSVWRSQQLGVPDSLPVFTQYPGSNAAYKIPYVSSINATGNPQPTYLLFSGPSGMQVDTYSGAITWTPQGSQIGTNSVTIRATNYAGYADWVFSLAVAPPAPSIPTNLTVVSVTDTSVILSWTPEDPYVGPVTYTIYSVTSSGGRDPQPIYTEIGTSPTNSVTLTGLLVGHSYSLAVKATAAGHPPTGYSSRVGATTTGPQSPTNLRLTGLTSTSVSLAWDPSPGPAQSPNFSAVTSYSIEQFIPGGQAIPKVIGLTNTFGTVTGLTPNTSAYWIVRAFDAQGYGSPQGYNFLLIGNPLPAPVTTSNPMLLAGGSFQFTASGAANQTALVETRTDLADSSSWVLLSSFMPSNNVFTFVDTNATGPIRFYRVTEP